MTRSNDCLSVVLEERNGRRRTIGEGFGELNGADLRFRRGCMRRRDRQQHEAELGNWLNQLKSIRIAMLVRRVWRIHLHGRPKHVIAVKSAGRNAGK